MRRWIAVIALCIGQTAGAQAAAVLHGHAVDSAGVGVPARISVRTSETSAQEVAHGDATPDGRFQIALPTLPLRITIEASTNTGLSARVELDSTVVRGSATRPIMLHLRPPQALAPVQVRARWQRRPAVFNFFEGEPSTRVQGANIFTYDWLDPLAASDLQAILRASPDLLIGSDRMASVLGAPGAANQFQINGVRVPGGLVGTSGGILSVSPWDVTIGGAAGATTDVFVGPPGKYQTGYVLLRSGISGIPGWIPSPGSAAGTDIPAQLTMGATGPLGHLGYRLTTFIGRDATMLPRWDLALDPQRRDVIDSVAGVLHAPTVRTSERNVQTGAIARLDFYPGDSKRVLGLTAALTRTTRFGGTRGGFVTGSAATDATEDIALLQLESTRVIGERVLWNSHLSTSLTKNELMPEFAAPTIIATDSTGGNVFITGGSARQPTSSVASAEARTTATWYSTNNTNRYVTQLQARVESAHLGAQPPHSTFISPSFSALADGEAIALSRESGSTAATTTSFVFAPAASARYDVGKNGSLSVGVRADAWATTGVATSETMRYVDVSPRVALLQRLGTRSANRGAIATLRIGAGRFTDWPSVQQWSAAWRDVVAMREACSGSGVPAIDLAVEAPTCLGGGSVQTIARTIAADNLRPTASNRADLSLAIAQIVPGVRGEVGLAVAQNTRMSAYLSPLANAPVLDRLAGEKNRALLVDASSIGANGVVPVAPIPSGSTDATELVSGASNTAAQWRASLSSRDPFARVIWKAAYTLTTGRERSLTVASPVGAPGFVTGPLSAGGRHTIALSLGEWIGETTIRVSSMIRSGARFTPLADRDLNGDGRVNDAAFIPADQSDAWANGVSSSVRSCIRASVGRIAATNSCTGPWSISSLVYASMPANRFGLRRGTTIDVQLSNPLAAVAGARGHSRVIFGDGGPVNPVLVHVTGFDAAAQQFRGEPLSGFGTPLGLAAGMSDPVRLAVSVRMPIGRSVTSQRADAALRTFARDTSMRGRAGAAMEYLADIPPIPIVILQSGEALQLTAEQRHALQALMGRWQASATRIVVGSVGDGRGDGTTTTHQRLIRARSAFMDEAIAITGEVRAILTPEQIELLGDGPARLLNPRFLHYVALQDAATF